MVYYFLDEQPSKFVMSEGGNKTCFLYKVRSLFSIKFDVLSSKSWFDSLHRENNT